MNTKALRQKILDLAIHGKLVPQDPNDEPASVLLERIKAEKERLIKEGKIKRTKRSKAACDKPHYENEDFDIPNSWTMAEMSDLFLLNPKNEVNDETEVGFVPMACVEDGFSGNHSFETRKWEDVKKGYCHFQNGDIGVAKISPCFENLKSCILHSLPNGVGTGTTELVILRSLGVYVPFYMYLFKSSWYISQGTKYFKGVVGQQRVNKVIFTDLKVPLPSVAEQERIVAEIKRWFTFIDIIEHEQSDLQESIKQAESKILELAIHGKLVPQDPTDEPATELLKRINPKAEITCDNPQYGKLPKGWCFVPLLTICDCYQPKTISTSQLNENGTYPVYGANGIIGRYSQYNHKDGEVLLTCRGATCGEVNKSQPYSWINGNAMVIHPLCSMDYNFLYYLAHTFKKYEGLISGTAQPQITRVNLRNIFISLPPINEQHRIVAKIEELFAQLDNITSSL